VSQYRLLPTPAQEAILRNHCGHARYVWNLAVEQHSHWRPGKKSAPAYVEQCRQLTQARAEHAWLAAGSQTVQQQALRDFANAMVAFFDPQNPARRPSWRKAGRNEGFRIVGRRGCQWDFRRLSRKTGEVWIPKVGWVRFRWSRDLPPGVKSYRVTRDRAGRWHIAFVAIPDPIPAPGTGEVVGIDRGVTVSAALSTGELLHAPGLTTREQQRLERKLARARRGSASTDIASRFDLIRVEGLHIQNMTRSAKGTRENPGRNVRAKAGLNREILRSGWGLLESAILQTAEDVNRGTPVQSSSRKQSPGSA
jgi:putative transposase